MDGSLTIAIENIAFLKVKFDINNDLLLYVVQFEKVRVKETI